MPLIVVYGVTAANAESVELGVLAGNIRKAIAELPELQLAENETSVFFPAELGPQPLHRTEIVAEVRIMVGRVLSVQTKIGTAVHKCLISSFNAMVSVCVVEVPMIWIP